jgi:hypothetical protein
MSSFVWSTSLQDKTASPFTFSRRHILAVKPSPTKPSDLTDSGRIGLGKRGERKNSDAVRVTGYVLGPGSEPGRNEFCADISAAVFFRFEFVCYADDGT